MTGPGMRREIDSFVMAGLVLAIHVVLSYAVQTWMPGIADKLAQSAQGRPPWPGMTISPVG
jgi:hypothetical protein